jgi:hypothetical protein
MGRRPRGVRWQRLGLMVLVVGLAVAGLASQPGSRGEGLRTRRAALPLPVPAPRPMLTRPVNAVPATSDEAPAPWWPVPDVGAGDITAAGQDLAEGGPLAPDIVVALDWPEPEGRLPFLRPSHVHATDSAQPGVGPALLLVDSVMGSGDGSEGLEPGALYWFGPQGLEKLQGSNVQLSNVQLSMEAQR